MLLTIHADISESDLGYLLLKNPARLHTFTLPFGQAHVFYPHSDQKRSAASLLLDIDTIALVRGRPESRGEGSLDQYVNDRPYVASSFMSVAMSRVFGTTMGGRSKERQALAEQKLGLSAEIAVIPCRGGESFLNDLFEPLGYEVSAKHYPLDEQFPQWGEGPYYTVRIAGEQRLQDLLTHLYVLIPVLDSDKHYWVGEDEVEKLLRKGEGWLAAHPQKELIARRYLRHDHRLTRDALAKLTDEDAPDPEASEQEHLKEELAIEAPLKLWEQRIGAVLSVLRAAGARSVIDLGCGEGRLLKPLLAERMIERIAGVDVSWRALEVAQRRLRLDQMAPLQRQRVELLHGSLMYRDDRLRGFDAAAVVEVIEHLDAPRLAAFERVVFEDARPGTVVITTPNSEYNVKFETLPHGEFRHKDHRFEWTRAQFADWAQGVAGKFGYGVRFLPVGPEDPSVGSPTQMGVFTR